MATVNAILSRAQIQCIRAQSFSFLAGGKMPLSFFDDSARVAPAILLPKLNLLMNLLPQPTKRFLFLLLPGLMAGFTAGAVTEFREVSPGVSYAHVVKAEVPWSIHVVKYDFARPEVQLTTSFGDGTNFGLSILRSQIQALPTQVGQAIAGVNGDFFMMAKGAYQGDPRGLQIERGELVSTPGKDVCFWVDGAGKPKAGKVISKLKITWPNGFKMPVGLNENRTDSTASLIAPILGSTRTTNGVELILERDGNGPWLPLRPNETYSARVREVREGGNTPLNEDVLILSLGQKLAARVPAPKAGMLLKISTALSPDMKGIQTAIGGGPLLVAKGKSLLGLPRGKLSHMNQRNPRTAVGWNGKEIFLVVVDGRKKDLSLGMTFPELANEMIELGCKEAMNLDGGGSTTMWLEGKVVNRPSEGSERRLGNALILVRKTSDSHQVKH
jgi:hypothetical protein